MAVDMFNRIRWMLQWENKKTNKELNVECACTYLVSVFFSLKLSVY